MKNMPEFHAETKPIENIEEEMYFSYLNEFEGSLGKLLDSILKEHPVPNHKDLRIFESFGHFFNVAKSAVPDMKQVTDSIHIKPGQQHGKLNKKLAIISFGRIFDQHSGWWRKYSTKAQYKKQRGEFVRYCLEIALKGIEKSPTINSIRPHMEGSPDYIIKGLRS